MEDYGLGPDTPVIPHASPDDVRGRNTAGVLPLGLAALAATHTELRLLIPPDLRGVELDASQLRKHLEGVATYRVERVS